MNLFTSMAFKTLPSTGHTTWHVTGKIKSLRVLMAMVELRSTMRWWSVTSWRAVDITSFGSSMPSNGKKFDNSTASRSSSRRAQELLKFAFSSFSTALLDK
eukprot:FR736709.1.p1 GENE.FR736709.1~~FR736709.1.p1  ORF type:complete len:101 (-),score=1.63 FR736709.1:103-405(-)